METKFQTSFIPKTSLDPIAQGNRKPMGLFTFLATIVFFISIVLGAGAFGFDKYLENKKVQLKNDLDKNIKAFEPQTISEYVRLNNRIDSAKEILKKHIAASYVFDFLMSQTLQSVSFTDFKYDLSGDGSALIALNGAAKSYNAVAYQSEVFGKERSLKDPLFSNLDLDSLGNVIFNFTTKIDPGFIAYTRKASIITDSGSGGIVPISTGDNGVLTPDTVPVNNSGSVFPISPNSSNTTNQ